MGPKAFYFGTFLLVILVSIFKLVNDDQKKLNYNSIFASSIEIIITSIGFIYALVEKDSKYQDLYIIVFVLLFLGLIFESERLGKYRWFANLSLMSITILFPAYFLFFQPDEKEIAGKLTEAEIRDLGLDNTVDHTSILKKICSEFLSGKESFDESDFTEHIPYYREEDEKNLFMACFYLYKGNHQRVIEYLNNIDTDARKTYSLDKGYILFKLYYPDYEKIKDLNLLDKTSWLGIDKEKIIEAQKAIKDVKKQSVKILLFNSSVAAESGLAAEAKTRLIKNGFNSKKITAQNDLIGSTSSVISYCKSEEERKILSEIHKVIFSNKNVLWGDTSEVVSRRSNRLIREYIAKGKADIIIRIPNEY